MIELINQLQTMAASFYKDGKDLEAAILYEALAKAYAQTSANLSAVGIDCMNKATILRRMDKSANHTFTITKGEYHGS